MFTRNKFPSPGPDRRNIAATLTPASIQETITTETRGSVNDSQMIFAGFNIFNRNLHAESFVCATESGFKIFNCEPFKETYQHFLGGGVRCMDVLFGCGSSMFALVGDGKHPEFPETKVC